MAARIVRRLYLYCAAFVGLQMLVAAFVELVTMVGERWIGGAPLADAAVMALRLGGSIALLLVGGPLWASHWAFAQRDALQDEGQRSVIRRVYIYAVLLVAALSTLFALQEALSRIFERLGSGYGFFPALQPLVTAAVGAGVWLGHWRIALRDRNSVEQTGAGATLRRWYLALTLWFSLGMTCFGAGVLMHGLLQRFAFGAPGTTQQLAMAAAALLSGLVIWLPHELWARHMVRAPGPLQANEVGATLRQVYAALVIVSALVAALTGLTALLAAGLQAALAVTTWAEALAGETRAAAAVLVAVPILLYYRAQVIALAGISTAPERVTTVYRILDYLTGAISLATLYIGLGGLAGTLARVWLGASIGPWRTPLSWYAAMSVVALPVFLLASRSSEGRARASADEELSLARRIYMYAGLAFGVIATATTATAFVRLVVVALLGQGDASVTSDIGQLVGYVVLGGSIAMFYGSLLRRASLARGTVGAGWRVVVVAGEPLRQSLETTLTHELPGATINLFDEHDTPERCQALASADLLIETLPVINDAPLATFKGPRLLLVAPVAGATLVGAPREPAGLAREAARAARRLCRTMMPARRPPAASTLSQSPA